MSLSRAHRKGAVALSKSGPPLKRDRKIRRETMKTMFVAAAAALSLSMGVANAGEIEGVQPYTAFQQLPGVIAMAPVQNPSVATGSAPAPWRSRQEAAGTPYRAGHLRSRRHWQRPYSG